MLSHGRQLERIIYKNDMYGIGTGTSPFLPKDPDTDNSISKLILFNNLSLLGAIYTCQEYP